MTIEPEPQDDLGDFRLRDDSVFEHGDNGGGEAPLIFFDLSRLLSRAKRPNASGIDRVELAYARYLLATARHRLVFTAINRWGDIAALPLEAMEKFVAALDSLWRGATEPLHARQTALAQARYAQIYLHVNGARALRRAVERWRGNIVYVLVSHHHLNRTAAIERLKRETGASFVCFVHDTIPVDHPELSRPTQVWRHRQRLWTVAHLADFVIVNSAATKQAFEQSFTDRRLCPILTAPLGVEKQFTGFRNAASGEHPYFVCVSTIEPKKNQMLLLNVWKKLRAELGSGTPHLLLIGRRKRMDNGVVREIKRSSELRGIVSKFDFLPDRDVARLTVGANAALLPSLAEGYGLAVAEALALGVPTLCSDLPALREVGRGVPEYLNPRDELSWHDAILEYARADSRRRQSQLTRLLAWRAPRWDDHFALVRPLLDGQPPLPTPNFVEPLFTPAPIAIEHV
ncbi:MAG TPA: glycosyltransferase family 1 protein [Xanthobacteraceae bacterium]|nr:glycosyltransferase family 1 protein [Xanthobacteraceae bacterium]